MEQLRLTLTEKFRGLLMMKPQKLTTITMIRQIYDYVEEHLSDPNLTLKRISEQYLFMNTDYVSEKISKGNRNPFFQLSDRGTH